MSQARALLGYNKASEWQLQQNLKTVGYFLKYLHKVDALGSSSLQLADYGSSEGYNSMVTFNNVLSQFRNSSSTPIMVYHTDTEENSWETLFKTINHSNFSYKRLENIYYSAIGLSFYNQLFPPNTVHLGYSVFSFHHLSKIPSRSNELSMIIPELRDQFIKDLTLNLSHRIKELVKGGYFILSIPVVRASDTNYLEEPLYEALKNLLIYGEITKEEHKNYMNQWYLMDSPGVDEVFRSFKDKIVIESNEITELASPFYLKYKQDGNIIDYKLGVTNFFKVLWKNNLRRCLNRSEEEKEKIIDRANQVLFESINDKGYNFKMQEIVFKKLNS